MRSGKASIAPRAPIWKRRPRHSTVDGPIARQLEKKSTSSPPSAATSAVPYPPGSSYARRAVSASTPRRSTSSVNPAAHDAAGPVGEDRRLLDLLDLAQLLQRKAARRPVVERLRVGDDHHVKAGVAREAVDDLGDLLVCAEVARAGLFVLVEQHRPPPRRHRDGLAEQIFDDDRRRGRARSRGIGERQGRGEQTLKLFRAAPSSRPRPEDARPGQVLAVDRQGLHVACGAGVVCVAELQVVGGKRMPAQAYAAGKPFAVGERLDDPPTPAE